MRIDSEAVMWSAPEAERATRPLLVLLHGYGSHEGDLFGLSPYLPLEPVIASLRGPLAEGPGYAWWSLANQAPGEPDADAVDAAAHAVLAWLDEQAPVSVSILGFSQGAATALQCLRIAPARFTRTVALSGFVATDEHAGDAALAAVKPHVFWGRGTLDRVITDAAVARTQRWLPAHAEADIRVYEGLPHSIAKPELDDVAAFLR